MSSRREDLLSEALELVTKNRNAQHGDPERNFDLITKLQDAYIQHIDRPLEAHDTAVLNILQKVARLAESPTNRDNWVDIAGYAACGWECAGEEPKKQWHVRGVPAQRVVCVEATDTLREGEVYLITDDHEAPDLVHVFDKEGQPVIWSYADDNAYWCGRFEDAPE